MKNIVAHSEEEYVDLICQQIYSRYLLAVLDHGFFTFVLSGGNTPVLIFKELKRSYSIKIDWSKVHFFWTDERCVEPNHQDSNYKSAYDSLLKYIQAGSINRIRGELEPRLAALNYEKEIKFFLSDHNRIGLGFDLILLGMGEDGHTASLFPNSDTLDERELLVVSTAVEFNGYQRVSLTLPVLNESKKILLVSSELKMSVLINNENRVLPIHLVKDDDMIAFVYSGVM